MRRRVWLTLSVLFFSLRQTGAQEQTVELDGVLVRVGRRLGLRSGDGGVLLLRNIPEVWAHYARFDPSLARPGMRVAFSGAITGSRTIQSRSLTIYPIAGSCLREDNISVDLRNGRSRGVGTIVATQPFTIRSRKVDGRLAVVVIDGVQRVEAVAQIRLRDIAINEKVTAKFVVQLNYKSSPELTPTLLRGRILHCKSIVVQRDQLTAGKFQAKRSKPQKRKRDRVVKGP